MGNQPPLHRVQSQRCPRTVQETGPVGMGCTSCTKGLLPVSDGERGAARVRRIPMVPIETEAIARQGRLGSLGHGPTETRSALEVASGPDRMRSPLHRPVRLRARRLSSHGGQAGELDEGDRFVLAVRVESPPAFWNPLLTPDSLTPLISPANVPKVPDEPRHCI